MSSVCGEIAMAEEKLSDRVDVLEETIEILHTENNELRRYVNNLTEELNAVITMLNSRYAEN